MDVYILNSKVKNRDYNGIILDENDFHPCKPFFIYHPQIKPESVNNIFIKGILEQHDYIRCVFRYCDYMLAVGGLLHIDYFCKYTDGNGPVVRSRGEWHYELSMVFKERIILLEKDKSLYGHFKLQKIEAFLPVGDTIDRWSFGIVSNGTKNDRILNTIKTIESFCIPEYEIIICGPAPVTPLPAHVRTISDEGMYKDLRIPISKKKNAIIHEAKYNNLVVMHDRIMFSSDWFSNMKLHGNYFDMLCCKIINEENQQNRMNDWVIANFAPVQVNTWKNVFLSKSSRLPYTEWSPDIYIAGGFFLMKKHFGALLDNHLNWAEKEDVKFSSNAYNEGMLFTFFADNTLYSEPARFVGANGDVFCFMKKIREWKYKYLLRRKELKEYNQYLLSL